MKKTKAKREFLIYLLLGALARYLLKVVRPFLGWGYTLIRIAFTKSLGWEDLRQYAEDVAVSEDQNANVYLKYPCNDTLLTKNAVDKFGFPDETLSSVFGKNKRRELYFKSPFLTKFGWGWARFLNRVEVEHVEKSIEDDEGNNKNITEFLD